MSVRPLYPFRRGLAVVMVLMLSGCQVAGGNQAGASPGTGGPSVAVTSPATDSGPATPSPPSHTTPSPASLPDVCALLSRSEVSTLTGGKSILSVDPDLGPNASVRYCQWQLAGARLAIQLSPTTGEAVRQDPPAQPQGPRLGDDAYFLSHPLVIRKARNPRGLYA